MSNTDPTQKPEMNPDACEGLAVLVSYKTPAVLYQVRWMPPWFNQDTPHGIWFCILVLTLWFTP